MQKATKGYNYKYNPSSQVLGAVRDSMNANGVMLIPRIMKTIFHPKNELEAKEHLLEAEMEMAWVNVDNPNDEIIQEFYCVATDTSSQMVGKLLTYAEKFSILKTFNIPTDEVDPDAFQSQNGNGHGSQPTGDKDGTKNESRLDVYLKRVDGYETSAKLLEEGNALVKESKLKGAEREELIRKVKEKVAELQKKEQNSSKKEDSPMAQSIKDELGGTELNTKSKS